jgi:hypothetical protein
LHIIVPQVFLNKNQLLKKWGRLVDPDLLLNTSKNNIKSKLSAELVRKRWHEIANLSFDSKRTLIIADYKLHENRIKTLNFGFV